jgi:pimeloyl-ACP methyl ester carboxylesterase
LEFIELVVNHAIDANQVTLLGFSQGSILSLAVALSYPQKKYKSDRSKWVSKRKHFERKLSK